MPHARHFPVVQSQQIHHLHQDFQILNRSLNIYIYICESKFKHSIDYLKLECTCERKTHISLMNEHVPCLTKSETRS